MNDPTCSVDGCEKPRKNNTQVYCSKHLQRWKTHGDPLYVRPPFHKPLCSIEGCPKLSRKRGWCPQHYGHWRATATPEMLLSRPKRGPKPRCQVEGCDLATKTQSGIYCSAHLHRLERYGDPTGVAPTHLPLIEIDRECTRCHVRKPLDQFGPVNYRTGWRNRRCHACEADMAREYRATLQGERRKKHRLIQTRSRVLGKFGEAGWKLWQQCMAGAGCEVCGQRTSKMAIDHNHDTGEVRGLLCGNCNTAMGLAGDSADRLRALADYLESKVTSATSLRHVASGDG